MTEAVKQEQTRTAEVPAAEARTGPADCAASAARAVATASAVPAPLRHREATAADVPALVALVESAYRGDSSRAGWTTEADLLDGQRLDADMGRELVGASGAVVLLFEQADQPGPADQADKPASSRLAACVQLEDRGDGVAYFGTFAVDPVRQGGGIGKTVMEVAEAEAARRWGADRMRMTVIRQRAELIAYYERRGYVRTGEREPFPYGQEQFGLPRRDDLEFVVLEKRLDRR